jgi:3-oxoacyl-[acyl-carrier-protein] synthase-3
MRYDRVFIDAVTYELPSFVVTTEELEHRLAPVLGKLNIAEGQLESLTGIQERRWWPANFSVAEGATLAAVKAIASSGLETQDIDALVYTGVCREYFEPATACHVAANLNLKAEAVVYDISNACLGMLNGIIDIANRIELKQIRAGLVVSCESAREITEDVISKLRETVNIEFFSASIATLTGGSGAAAVLLTDGSFNPAENIHKLLGGVNRSSAQFHDLCRWGIRKIHDRVFEQFMTTDAGSVLKYGLSLGTKTWQLLLQELGWCKENVNKIVTHQIGKSHRLSFMRALELEDSIDFPTFAFLGNIGSVSVPITTAMAAERGHIRRGDRVGLLGIGSGLNCMMLGVEW